MTDPIPVTVFVRPNGEQREAFIGGRPEEIVSAAKEFIARGGRFTVEELSGMGTSYCAEFPVDGEIMDVACEIGFDSDPPNVKHLAAFDRCVLNARDFKITAKNIEESAEK